MRKTYLLIARREEAKLPQLTILTGERLDVQDWAHTHSIMPFAIVELSDDEDYDVSVLSLNERVDVPARMRCYEVMCVYSETAQDRLAVFRSDSEEKTLRTFNRVARDSFGKHAATLTTDGYPMAMRLSRLEHAYACREITKETYELLDTLYKGLAVEAEEE